MKAYHRRLESDMKRDEMLREAPLYQGDLKLNDFLIKDYAKPSVLFKNGKPKSSKDYRSTSGVDEADEELIKQIRDLDDDHMPEIEFEL